MPALAFINLDGSPQLEGVNKKLVRAHVAKHFHPSRHGRQGQQGNSGGSQQPRRLAPNLQPIADISALDTEDTTMESYGKDFQEEGDPMDQEIDPAAVASLLNSGASREKNLQIGWVHGANKVLPKASVLGTPTQHTSKRRLLGTQGRSPVPRTKNLDSILPCPQVADLLLPPGLGNPTVASRSPPQARSLVERYVALFNTGAQARGFLPFTHPYMNAYLPAAMNNHTLWHANVSFASVIIPIFQGLPADPISLKYKGDTIRAINSNLHDSSGHIMDETIAAVQTLATMDCLCKDFDAFGVHLRALSKMVELRGGLETLGFDGLLARLIQMHEWRWDLFTHDIQQDIIFSSPRPQPAILPKLLLFTLGSPETESPISTRPISILLIHLQNLALTWDTQASCSSSLASISFEKGCNNLYDQMSELGPPDKPEKLWTTADYEFECFRLACLVYSGKSAESEQTRLKARRTQELHQYLNRTALSRYWVDIPGALIWCLAVGVKESQNRAQYSWFMAYLLPMLTTLVMECWDDLQISLGTFGWLLKCGRMRKVLARP